MKNLLKFIVAFVLVISANVGSSQNFLSEEFSPQKTYVLLGHPTVENIKTIDFLVNNRLLDLPNVEFVGVFSAAEMYDYSKSVSLIKKPGMEKFHLQKIGEVMDASHIYVQNEWTPTFKALFNLSVGMFFFGGPDIQPEVYGRENQYSVVTDPNRHLFELSFMFHLLGGRQNELFVPFMKEKPGYFVSGFCLGMQSMNVATGGTLIQDIPNQIYRTKCAEEILKLGTNKLHCNYWSEIVKDSLLMPVNFHQIEFTAHPFFTKRVKAGTKLMPFILSSHHQCIDELGKDLIVTALSEDGRVIEAIQHRLFENVFAVQFHPEVPALYREGKKLKFAPGDTPKPYSAFLSANDRQFHEKYWATITKAIKTSIKLQQQAKVKY